MKAIVFGAGGQVGRALCVAPPPGVDVVALGRSDCDLSRPGSAATAIAREKPSLVINAAAYTAVDRAESEADLARRLNAEAAGEIAAAAAEAGARLVHISTDFVFGGSPDGTLLTPDDPAAPLGVYGRTKLAGEEAVRAAMPGALIVRTAWVYAAKGANFVATMLRLMRERDELRVVADQIGTPTWAGSLAPALWQLARGDIRGTHHFTDAGVASWYDFAVAIAEEAAAIGLVPGTARIVPIATRDYPTPARRPSFSVLDKSETWAACGGPAPHWRANLRRCLEEISQRA